MSSEQEYSRIQEMRLQIADLQSKYVEAEKSGNSTLVASIGQRLDASKSNLSDAQQKYEQAVVQEAQQIASTLQANKDGLPQGVDIGEALKKLKDAAGLLGDKEEQLGQQIESIKREEEEIRKKIEENVKREKEVDKRLEEINKNKEELTGLMEKKSELLGQIGDNISREEAATTPKEKEDIASQRETLMAEKAALDEKIAVRKAKEEEQQKEELQLKEEKKKIVDERAELEKELSDRRKQREGLEKEKEEVAKQREALEQAASKLTAMARGVDGKEESKGGEGLGDLLSAAREAGNVIRGEGNSKSGTSEPSNESPAQQVATGPAPKPGGAVERFNQRNNPASRNADPTLAL